ncbi:MAG: FtsX-like permease family protein [bacterium]
MITMFSMAFGLSFMIVSHGLMIGMADQMVYLATSLNTGHIQLHQEGYLGERSIYTSIKDPSLLLKKLDSLKIGHSSVRAYSTALISSGPQSTGAALWGIDPVAEREVTDLYKHMGSGNFLVPEESGKVVLGKHLAEKLNIGPGEEIILLAQAADGSLGNDIYIVKGVLNTVGAVLDRAGVIMSLADLDLLLSLEGRVHEIAVRLDKPDLLEMAASKIKTSLNGNSSEVKTWKEIMPAVSQMVDLHDVSSLIILFVIFAVASLGIMNTQLMSIFERTREIGVMRAIGMGPLRVIALIGLETMYMTIMAGAAGSLVGALWSLRLQTHGLDLRKFVGEFDLGGIMFDTLMKAHLSFSTVIEPLLVMIFVVFLASLYPAIRVARISPVDALGRGR